MVREKMTVHQALSELKTLDNRIDKAIREAKFASSKKSIATTVSNMKVDDFKKQGKSQLQSINDLFARRDAIKSALVLSNAQTSVTVGGETFTIAEAIYKKDSLKSEKLLLTKLANTVQQVHDRVALENETLSDNALKYAQEIAGNKDKLDPSMLEAMTKLYKQERAVEVVEGFDVRKEMEERYNKVEEFLSTIDFRLSESNTVTLIEIEY